MIVGDGLRRMLLLLMCWLAIGTPASYATGHRDEQAAVTIRDLEQGYAAVHDYTATLLMRERVRGTLLPPETIALKFAEPFRVYMRWIDGPGKGRQLLYVEGAADDKMLVREPGLMSLFTLHLDPRGAVAMHLRRHPITEVGIGGIVRQLRSVLARDDVVLVDLGDDDSRPPLRRLEITLSEPGGEEWRRLRLGIDQERKLPVEVERFDAQGSLLESYRYDELQLNVGLGSDFDPDNDAYGF
jgi:Protein of unknown function (DUF1571)